MCVLKDLLFWECQTGWCREKGHYFIYQLYQILLYGICRFCFIFIKKLNYKSTNIGQKINVFLFFLFIFQLTEFYTLVLKKRGRGLGALADIKFSSAT